MLESRRTPDSKVGLNIVFAAAKSNARILIRPCGILHHVIFCLSLAAESIFGRLLSETAVCDSVNDESTLQHDIYCLIFSLVDKVTKTQNTMSSFEDVQSIDSRISLYLMFISTLINSPLAAQLFKDKGLFQRMAAVLDSSNKPHELSLCLCHLQYVIHSFIHSFL